MSSDNESHLKFKAVPRKKQKIANSVEPKKKSPRNKKRPRHNYSEETEQIVDDGPDVKIKMEYAGNPRWEKKEQPMSSAKKDSLSRRESLISHINKIPKNGYKTNDMVINSRTRRRAKELFKTIYLELASSMFPGNPELCFDFISIPRSKLEDKYAKLQNNVLDLYFFGEPSISQVCTSILAISLSNKEAKRAVEKRKEELAKSRPEASIRSERFIFGKFKFRQYKRVYGKLSSGESIEKRKYTYRVKPERIVTCIQFLQGQLTEVSGSPKRNVTIEGGQVIKDLPVYSQGSMSLMKLFDDYQVTYPDNDARIGRSLFLQVGKMLCRKKGKNASFSFISGGRESNASSTSNRNDNHASDENSSVLEGIMKEASDEAASALDVECDHAGGEAASVSGIEPDHAGGEAASVLDGESDHTNDEAAYGRDPYHASSEAAYDLDEEPDHVNSGLASRLDGESDHSGDEVASVLSGKDNEAIGEDSSGLQGEINSNNATFDATSLKVKIVNDASSKHYTSAPGNELNNAIDKTASVSDEYDNRSNNVAAQISGGNGNYAISQYSSAMDREPNQATIRVASILDRYSNPANALVGSSASNGRVNADSAQFGLILGGMDNVSDGKKSPVLCLNENYVDPAVTVSSISIKTEEKDTTSITYSF